MEKVRIEIPRNAVSSLVDGVYECVVVNGTILLKKHHRDAKIQSFKTNARLSGTFKGFLLVERRKATILSEKPEGAILRNVQYVDKVKEFIKKAEQPKAEPKVEAKVEPKVDAKPEVKEEVEKPKPKRRGRRKKTEPKKDEE